MFDNSKMIHKIDYANYNMDGHTRKKQKKKKFSLQTSLVGQCQLISKPIHKKKQDMLHISI